MEICSRKHATVETHRDHRTPDELTALIEVWVSCCWAWLRGKMYPGDRPWYNESQEWWKVGQGGSLCTTFQLHNIRCVHSKSDWHFDGQSKNNFLKGFFVPSFKIWLSIKWNFFLKKKCNEMWLVQMSVKFIVLLKSYWVFVYEMYFSVFEV